MHPQEFELSSALCRPSIARQGILPAILASQVGQAMWWLGLLPAPHWQSRSSRTQVSIDPLNMAEETHPLQNEWVLWEHKAAEKKDPSKWKENMKQLCVFSTVEQFWSYFNHLPKPSEVFFDGDSRKKVGSEERTVEEYSLFKKGIEPEWGDPQNVIGGEWFCRQSFDPEVLDLYWHNLVVGIVGETIEDAVDEDDTFEDRINGARVVDKSRNFPMYKLEVWINSRDPKVKEKLRERLEEVLTDGQSASRKMHPKFEWKDHSG